MVLTGFLYHLRAHGVRVTTTEWLSLMRALAEGHGRASLGVLYHLARALLVKSEAQYDAYDRAFAEYFQDLPALDVTDELLAWLQDPKNLPELTAEQLANMPLMDLDTLRAELEKRLAEQKERHDGGNRFIGTGGTSPFGHGGQNPQGVRIGGAGGGRTAVQIAESRRFQNLRHDRVLDTRQIGVALRRLRRLARDTGPLELSLDKTIDKSAREGGEIELCFEPARDNRVKLLLLLDVGGSMDPHADVCERLFSAAHQASHFHAFEHYFFHNCPYARLYRDMGTYQGVGTEEVLHKIDRTWTVMFVGDAWMSPFELTHAHGSISLFDQNVRTGVDWLRAFQAKTERAVWLNPEPARVWEAPSVRIVRHLFPMFELTLDGLDAAVDHLRGQKKRPVLQELGRV